MAILGVTSLTGCNSIPDFIATSTGTIFRGTNAPTGWTKLTDIDNRALRVIASGALSPGGVSPFTDVFTSTRTFTGSTGGTSLSTAQIPAHDHANGVSNPVGRSPGLWAERLANNNTATGDAGGGAAHSHPITSSSLDFDILYSDVIRCTKD